MRAIVVGCGRAGAEMAARLFRRGHQVTVIDVVSTAFDNLPADFRGHQITGEVLNRDVLLNAGIEEADCLATLTNSDSVNAVVAHIARSIFQTPIVVVRNYDPRWLPLHEAFGHQVVSSVTWSAERFEELIVNAEAPRLLAFDNSPVGIFTLHVGAGWKGARLAELISGEGMAAVALTRGNSTVVPGADFKLQEGDLLHVSTTKAGAATLRERLKGEH